MRLKILDCRQIYQGHNRRGDSFTVYEIKAARAETGQPINEKLRAFTSLAVGQEIDVNVQVYNSEQWGKSFTLYPKGARSESATGQLNELRERVNELENWKTWMTKEFRDLSDMVAFLRGNGRQAQAPAAPRQDPEQTAALDERFGKDAPW